MPAADVIPLTVDLLNDFYSQVEPDVRAALDRRRHLLVRQHEAHARSRSAGARDSTSRTVKNRVFYCLDDGYIAFDEPFLQERLRPDRRLRRLDAAREPVGDLRADDPGHPGRRRQRRSPRCSRPTATPGGWAAAFYNGYLAGGSLSPGDLDEIVQAFLVYSRARGVSADMPITFVRVRFFRQRLLLAATSRAAYDGIAARRGRI